MFRLTRLTRLGATFISVRTFNQLTEDNFNKSSFMEAKIKPVPDIRPMALEKKKLMHRQYRLDEPASFARFFPSEKRSMGILLMHNGEALMVPSKKDGVTHFGPAMTLCQEKEDHLSAAWRGFQEQAAGPIIPSIFKPGEVDLFDFPFYIVYNRDVLDDNFRALYVVEVPTWFWKSLDLKYSRAHIVDFNAMKEKDFDPIFYQDFMAHVSSS